MRKNNLLYILFILFSFKVSSQTSYVLSYETFLKNILEHHPVAQKANNIKQYGELQYKASKGNFDPNLSGTYDNKFFNNSNYYSVLSSGVKIPLFTAQNLKVGYEYGVGANVNPEQYTSSYGMPYLGIEVGLLQGLFLDYRRAEVMKSKEYVGYYSAEKKIQLNELLFESSLKYFDWLFSVKQVSLNNYFLDLARQRLLGIESLASIGEKAAVDTVEAAIFYQSRLLELQTAIIESQKQNYNVASLNWQSLEMPAMSIYAPQDSLDKYFERVKNQFVLNLYQDSSVNPIIEKYKSIQSVLKIENRIKQEMIKPKLNVNYNFLSYNYNSFSPVYTQNNYKWGVDLSFPLLLRKSRNEYKMSKLNYQNNTLELANKNNEIEFKLSALKQNISVLAEQLQNAERSVRYNKLLVDAEKLKFSNGESSLFILNSRENKWLESELKFSEYKLKFIKNVLTIIYLNGSLNYQL
ncbi:MAG TPA: TolC family protein [Bacteroidia bacterium]|nr:TolC family protein [Bacteroidia bacterium]